MAKHWGGSARTSIKKAAIAGGVAATSAAMTMGLTAPSASALPLVEARAVAAEVQNLALTDALNLAPLLGALGVDLGSINGPLDALELAGINLVTTGPPFGLAALFGLNLGYVPAFPPLIVDEVTGTDTVVNGAALAAVLGPLLSQLLGPEGAAFAPVIGGLLGGARVPIVIGFGLGSLAVGIAYPQIEEYFTETDRSPNTFLPLILLRNPGRADGGIAARFAPVLDPFLRIFGYESVVTPDVENSGNPLLGNAFRPIKIDATVEYDTLSDFPSWPNPFSLANSAAAFAFPTYILRGADLGAVGEQAEAGLPAVLASLLGLPGGNGNLFLTVPVDSLPLLEPFRYPTDFANLFTGGVFGFTNPFADAIEPALKILVNLGYTNVTQDMSIPLDPYPRDFSGNFGSEYAPFFTFPENVDWGQVPGDLVTAFAAGVQNSFFTGIPGVRGPLAGPNPLAIIAGLLGLPTGPAELPDLLNAFPDLAELIGGNLVLPDLNSTSALAAAAAPPVGGSDDPLTRLGETLARTLNIAFEREAPVEYTPPTSPVDSAFDVGEGLGASGLRLLAATVLGPTRLAALAEGGPEALADLIENTVDAPLWIADPALYGLRDALPADAAGNVTAFRDSLWALTERINEALLGALADLPNAPADVRITKDDAAGDVGDEDIEATLKVAGAEQPGQPAGDLTSDLPPADNSGDAPKVVLDGEENAAPNGDEEKAVNRGPQFRGGQISKAIERSIDQVGDRLNDAADDLRDGVKKALTPPSRTTTTDNDTADTANEPAQ